MGQWDKGTKGQRDKGTKVANATKKKKRVANATKKVIKELKLKKKGK
jgi:hypothetical protein